MQQHPPAWAIEAATEAARKSWCAKDQRGVVVWSPTRTMRRTSPIPIHVTAANGPPEPFKCGGQPECRAACGKLAGHAEERALWRWFEQEAVGNERPHMLHVKLDEAGKAVPGGPPSCITCSRTMLMAGASIGSTAAGIWLWHAEGWRWYEAVEFHTLSITHEKHGLPVIR